MSIEHQHFTTYGIRISWDLSLLCLGALKPMKLEHRDGLLSASGKSRVKVRRWSKPLRHRRLPQLR